MKEKGFEPVYYLTSVKAGDCVSTQEYQRAVKNSHVAEIIDNFDPVKFDPIKVIRRESKNYVFDGQHRLVAAISMFGKDCKVPALVYKVMPYEVEAELFAKQDEGNKKLTTPERLKAFYEAGEAMVVRFHDIVEEYGYDCNWKTPGGFGNTRMIGSYQYLYHNILVMRGEPRLRRVLGILNDAWGKTYQTTQLYLLKGINEFLNVYEGEYDRNKLVRNLRNTTPQAIKDRGDGYKSVSSKKKYARAILDVYNYRAKEQNQLPIRI